MAHTLNVMTSVSKTGQLKARLSTLTAADAQAKAQANARSKVKANIAALGASAEREDFINSVEKPAFVIDSAEESQDALNVRQSPVSKTKGRATKRAAVESAQRAAEKGREGAG